MRRLPTVSVWNVTNLPAVTSATDDVDGSQPINHTRRCASVRALVEFADRTVWVPDAMPPMTRTENDFVPIASAAHFARQPVLSLLLLISLLTGSRSGAANEREPLAVDQTSRAFFTKHCLACHAGKKPKGAFSLDALRADLSDRASRSAWERVLEQVTTEAMPPGDHPQPTAAARRDFADGLRRRLAAAASQDVAQGRVILRRLNRAEYINTVRDLLDVRVDLEDLLPPDTSASGFDNSSETQHVSSYLMENYLEAAERVLDAAISHGKRPQTITRRIDIKAERTVKPTGSVYRHTDDGVAIFSSWASANIQVTLWNYRTHERGRYRIRISGYGYQTEKPVTFHVMAGTLTAVTEQRMLDYYEVPPKKPTVVEIFEQLEAKNTFRIVTDGLGALPPEVQKIGAENYKGPGLVVQWVEVEGPLLDNWPPRSHRLLMGDLKQAPVPTAENPNRLEVVSDQPLVDAERVLRSFARRAFRRAVTDADIQPYLARVKSKLDEKVSFEQALRVGLRGILVSPHFLFLRESPRPVAGSAEATPGAKWLDDYALASRLSYFLWSSMPDEELLRLAERGELSRPETLRKQVERLLQDSKAAAFTQNFAGQWLGLRAIDATVPDRYLYPEYDDILKVAMLKEVYQFFDEVLRNDLSLTNFVASDFSILNGRLAKHYGITGVDGLEMRKVPLPVESHRGGVMTMAAVLKVTANGTTTSPILRGAWVLDRMLGTPPPKPSVDVEAVEPDIRGATTIRTQLAKHRQLAECAGCHAKIDPPGFALEQFDVIGGFRTYYRKVNEGEPTVVNGRRVRYLPGPPVEPADVLPDGRRFADIDEYKALLLRDKDLLAKALAEKLLTYATGAAPTASDQPDVAAIVARSRASQYGFRSLIQEIVQSETFRTR